MLYLPTPAQKMTKEFNRVCQKTEQRAFMIVLHDYTVEHVARLHEFYLLPAVKAIGWNHELCPTTGRPHLQGAIMMKDNTNWPNLKKRIGINTMRLELAESAQAVFKYSEKMETRDPAYPDSVLLGTPPMSQKRKGEKGEEYYERNITALLEGRPEDMDASAELQLKQYEYAVKRRKERLPQDKLEEDTTEYCHWHMGGTGTGKTFYCMEQQVMEPYQWTSGTGWETYQGQDIVCFADVDADHRPNIEEMKVWFQPRPFPINVKFGGKEIRPKLMVVCSNEETFEECFTGVKARHIAAIKRRFTVHDWGDIPYYIDADPKKGLNPEWKPPATLEGPEPPTPSDEDICEL